MGSVWRAEHLALRSPVAIKLIDPSLANSEEALMRFLREAQAAASLRSPHVVQILDHGVDQGVPYIVMELLDGESLAARLERVGKLAPADTARVLTHVARAMSLAHGAGIVHRDLKPDNLFLVRNDDEEIIKVLDFGIAKAAATAFDITTGTRTGAMLGSPFYMSPEQVEGSKDLDHRTDLWSMAIIAFECVTGTRPFESASLGSLLLQICSKSIPVPSEVAEVPPGFDSWFARGTEREPAKRFQSAREFAETLRAALAPGATGVRAAVVTPKRTSEKTTIESPGDDASPSMIESAAITRSTFPGRRSMAPVWAVVVAAALLGAAAWWFGSRPNEAAAGFDDAAHPATPHITPAPLEPVAAPSPPAALPLADTAPPSSTAPPSAAPLDTAPARPLAPMAAPVPPQAPQPQIAGATGASERPRRARRRTAQQSADVELPSSVSPVQPAPSPSAPKKTDLGF